MGVGVNILPHAIKVPVELDLLEELDAVAIRTRELIMTDRRGNGIWREARGLHAGYDVPQFSIHRGCLQGVLYRAACERLGETAVVLKRRLVGFEQDWDGVLAQFCDQSGNYAETLRASGTRGLPAHRRRDRSRRAGGDAEVVCERRGVREGAGEQVMLPEQARR